MSVDRDFHVHLHVVASGYGTDRHAEQLAYAVARALRIALGETVRVFWNGGPLDGSEIVYDAVVDDGEPPPGYEPRPGVTRPPYGSLSDPPDTI